MAFRGGLPTICSTRLMLAAVAAVVGFGSGAVGPVDVASAEVGLVRRDAPLVIEADDPSIDVQDPDLIAQLREVHDDFEQGTSLSVPGAALSGLQRAAVDSGMRVSFDATYLSPGSVQAVVLAAASDWDAALSTTVAAPVEIAVIWKDLGNPSLLGSAGPNGLYSGPSLPTTSYYPAPLANTLLGYDVNGGGTPELTVNLNSTANWYIATSGSPGSGQIDLYTVILHEIGHGLGFLGSASLYNEAPNTVPTVESTPFVFDHEVTYNGTDLLSLGDPDSLLQSSNLYLDISDALNEKLYAPSTWAEGSSFSHFDEASHPAGSPGSLMTPSLGSQEVARQLDAPTLSLMERMGWPMRIGPASPTITSTVPSSGQITVNWNIDLAQTGLAPDSFRIEAWAGASLSGSTTAIGSGTFATVGGLLNGTTYTVNVVAVSSGQDGAAATTSVSLATASMTPRAINPTGLGLSRTLTWLPAPGVAATSYEAEHSADGGVWSALGSTAGLSMATTVTEGIHQFRVRAHDAHGAGAWGYSVPVGISSGVVRPVPLDGQISRLYQAYFLRSPDPEGFTFWRDQRAAGVDLTVVSNAFASSAEFVANYGSLDDGQFVDLVYLNVLNRAADGAGRSYWLGVLAGGTSRGQVMIGFSDSAEFIARTGTSPVQSTAEAEVYRLYVASFLRLPDQAGYDYWVGQRVAGVSLEAIASAFATSAEFQAAYGALGNSEFVELIYNNVLARSSDPAGASYWVWLLSTGTARGTMMTGFSESVEFILTTGTLP
ncbi:MAG: DUF4214 domain-containing protein [Actinomycetia bacterium]|nr:DUF4214 domain-containing protein [Actinomycetes bacterium]